MILAPCYSCNIYRLEISFLITKCSSRSFEESPAGAQMPSDVQSLRKRKIIHFKHKLGSRTRLIYCTCLAKNKHTKVFAQFKSTHSNQIQIRLEPQDN